MAELVPNPGSAAALELGCRCPVLDNGHGRGEGPFWISELCPVHSPPSNPAAMRIVSAAAREQEACVLDELHADAYRRAEESEL